MANISCPHDNAFKTLMMDKRVAKSFFQAYLPEKIKSKINYDTLELCPGSYVDVELSTSHSDILYSAKIGEETCFIYLLCEHKSRIEEMLPFQGLQYKMKIWEQYIKQTGSKKLPFIITIVFYHGKKPYNKSLDLRDLISMPADFEPEDIFKIHLIDTNGIENKELREHIWSDIMVFVFKNIFARDFSIYIDQFISLIANLEKLVKPDHRMHNFIETLIKYLWNVSEMTQPSNLIDRARDVLSCPVGETVMKAADVFNNQAFERGIEQGYIKTLQILIETKFGQLSPEKVQKIEKANSLQINHWLKSILTVEAIDELFIE